MTTELEKIKKIYGEKFAHLCRTLFPTILEKDGLLLEILTKRFAPTHSLYDDIVNENQLDFFVNIIQMFYQQINKSEEFFTKSDKNAEELMDLAGYVLYPECKTEEDIKAFKKYYKRDEMLCTFLGDRLKYARVWFAVKKNVDQIKRENFPFPERQDEYGTSVISIQFTKGLTSHLSIKNRYNHKVNNPDATFSNNLENIIPGLSNAFMEEYGIHLITKNLMGLNLKNYVFASDGMFYRYNMQVGGIFYCENNIVIDDQTKQVVKFDGNKKMLIDNYVLDLENKKLTCYNLNAYDSFVDTIYDIKNISIKKSANKEKVITLKLQKDPDIIITIDSHNAIVGYKNHAVLEIWEYFMRYNKTLREIDIPNVTKIEDNFLSDNIALQSLNLPKLKSAGKYFLASNECMNEINLPKLKVCGTNFLSQNKGLKSINLPNLKIARNNFLAYNEQINSVNMPNVRYVGINFMSHNSALTELNLPNLIVARENFLFLNKEIKNANFPKLKKAYKNFLNNNIEMKKFNLPQLLSCGENFLEANEILDEFSAPKLKATSSGFLAHNKALKTLSLRSLEKINEGFVGENKNLGYIILPKLQKGEYLFLKNNTNALIYAPKCGFKNKTVKKIESSREM